MRQFAPLATEVEIKQSYAGRTAARDYVGARFNSELMQLLNDRQVAAVNRHMRALRPQRTLEIAPGPGRVTRSIVPDGDLVCLEFNRAMIEVGQATCPSATIWIKGNAFELPFIRAFDFAYSFRFIRHFHRRDRNRLYRQIWSVVRPGGLFVMDAVNERVSGPLRAAAPQAYPIFDKLYRDPMELQDELEAAGFTVVDVEPVQRWYTAQYRAQVLLGPRSRWLCRAAIHTLERLRQGPALEWIVTARRV
jgi:ubiquinone/menaquinone biosynthesis C-methylase UbiE